MRKILGITGSIASGKSLFCNILGDLGFTVIDSDQIVHELYQPGNKGYKALTGNKAFKPEIPLNSDKTIDRNKLRKIVFENKAYKEKIEKIIHPLTTEQIKKSIKKLSENTNIAVEIPLLFEKKLENLVDITVCVQSPMEKVIERIIEKFTVSEEDAFKILKNQMPVNEKLYQADIIILNNDGIDAMKEKGRALIKILEREEITYQEQYP